MATVMDGVQQQASLSFPIVRKEYTPDGDLVVYGKATDGTVDSDNQIVDTDWSGKALQEWLATGGNVRVQHSPHLYPAGKGIEVEVGKDGAHWVRSLVVEPTAKALVEKGVLTSYSVGIARPQIVRSMDAPGGKIVGGQIAEVSLVDRPANKNCGFQLCKSADDGTAEFVGKVFGSSPLIAAQQISKREQAADSGAAMPDGSFPIKNGSDLGNAIHLAGNAKNPGAARAHIKRRAAALGMSDRIPDSWKAEEADVEKADGKHCPKCGESVDADTRSCPDCGSKIAKGDGPDVEEREDADLDKGGDDGKPEFLKGFGRRPTEGVRAKDSEGLAPHREPDGEIVADLEHDAGLPTDSRGDQDDDDPPGWSGKSDPWYEDFAAKVGPKGYSHGWVKIGDGPPKKGEDLAFEHGGKTFVGMHDGTSGDHVHVAVQEKDRPGGTIRFRVPKSEVRRGKGKAGGESAWHGTHPATEADLDDFKKSRRKAQARSRIQSGHPSVTGPGRGTINSAGNRVGKSFGMDEATYAVGRLHDALCAAFTDEVIKAEYPSMNGVIGALNDAWDDLDDTARGLVKGLSDVMDDQGLVLDDARASLTKAFGDMYPNVRLTPGKITAGQFTRPYLSAGHPAQSIQSPGTQHSPSQAGFGTSTELHNASQFNRANITEGHARTAPGSGGNNGNAIPGARSASQRLAAASKNVAANAMQNLHDHLAESHPYLCPMSPGSPGQLQAVSKGEIEQLVDSRIAEIRKGYEDQITELRAMVDQLGSQPDPNAAPHRGVMVAKSASGGTGPVDRRSLVEEAHSKEDSERRAFFASIAASGDPQMREAARRAMNAKMEN